VLSSASLDNAETVQQQSKTTATPKSLTLFTPCKINLFLRILNKRESDGYHNLASLFQCVGLGDTLTLSLLPTRAAVAQEEGKGGADVFTCNMVGVPTDSSNLVIRALEVMRQKLNIHDQYFTANLMKCVPAQAGLGGGSANAATAMWGVNELLGQPATLPELIDWSAELGSDITFFLSQGTAYCTGRGEIMTSIVPPLPSGTKLSIVKPDLGLSTPMVFKALDYNQLSTRNPEELRDAFLSQGVVNIDNTYYINDLEQPAFDCLPELKALKEELLCVDGFHHIMMSGSGTSIYCIGEPKDMKSFMSTFNERVGISVFNTEFISREDGKWFESPKND
jgi:4-diphosphocytidyl-2-C-methyl-D-erythritol kinase